MAQTDKRTLQIVDSIGPEDWFGENSFVKDALNMANQTKENPINYITMYLYPDTHSINHSTIEVFVEQP